MKSLGNNPPHIKAPKPVASTNPLLLLTDDPDTQITPKKTGLFHVPRRQPIAAPFIRQGGSPIWSCEK